MPASLISRFGRMRMAVAAALLLGLAACAAPFNANVSRFQSQLPAPAGQTFAVVADDPALAGGIEFSQYAQLVRAAYDVHCPSGSSVDAKAQDTGRFLARDLGETKVHVVGFIVKVIELVVSKRRMVKIQVPINIRQKIDIHSSARPG